MKSTREAQHGPVGITVAKGDEHPLHRCRRTLDCHVIRLPEDTRIPTTEAADRITPSPALDHVGHNGAGHQEDALQVNADHQPLLIIYRALVETELDGPKHPVRDAHDA